MATATGQFTPSEGSDFYYACLYLPAEQRQAAHILGALRDELLNIPETCDDLGVAHTKLAWWRTEIANIPIRSSAHPLAAAFSSLVERNRTLVPCFCDFIDSIVAAQQPRRFHSEEELGCQVENMHAGTVAAMLNCHATQPVIEPLPSQRLIGLTERARAILDIRNHRHHVSPLISQQALAENGLTLELLRDAARSDDIHGLALSQLSYLHSILLQSTEELDHNGKKNHRLCVSLARFALRRIELTLADGCRVLERRLDVTPLRKLWIAWRTQRGF